LCIYVIRYAYPWWKEKVIDSEKKRKHGGCPLTPEETALTLRALDIDPSIQIYIAAGNIYGGERRMAPLREGFPNLVSRLNNLKGMHAWMQLLKHLYIYIYIYGS
jgi:hypothetical protein